MDNQQQWMDVIKRLPAWASGTISLVTALSGLVLLLQGQRQLGMIILAIVGVVALLVSGAYLAFARTPPLVEGGRGVYRFERYRHGALIGIGFVLGFVSALLLSQQNRAFVMVAFFGPETSALTSTPAPAGEANFAPRDTPGGTAARPLSPSVSSPSGSAAATPSGEDVCFEHFFSDVPADRVKDIEVGTGLRPLIGPSQPKDAIVALKFTEFNRPIGATKFSLFPENSIFKIASVIDANCQEIEELSNTSGGDKRVLNDGDSLQVRFGGHDYVLQLIYDPGASTIFLGYFQSSGKKQP